MHLLIDIGNSQIHYGIIDAAGKLVEEHRLNTSDISLFESAFLDIKSHNKITDIAISSVVPSADSMVANICIDHFAIKPFFLNVDTCPYISFNRFDNPYEIGADLLASAVYAAVELPNTNTIIVDLGTAITITAINKNKEFLGGIIMPGINTQLKALVSSAEQLHSISIKKPSCIISNTTEGAINSGIINGTVGGLKHLIEQAAKEQFHSEEYCVIATGGFSALFTEYKLFNKIIPDLVLQGLLIAATHRAI